MNTDLTQMF